MKKEVIAHKNPKSPISEVFRTLRTNIQFMNVSKKINFLLTTKKHLCFFVFTLALQSRN